MEHSSPKRGAARNLPNTELLSASLGLSEAMPARRVPSRTGSGRLLHRAIVVLLALVALSVLASIAYVGSVAVSVPSLEIDLPDGTQDLSPDTAIAVAASGFFLRLESFTLYEKRIGVQGQIETEQWIPIQVQGATSGWLHTEQQGRLVRPDDGEILALNGHYELTVTGSALQLSWNGLQRIPLSRQVTFTTAITARPLLSDAPIVASVDDFISVRWNVPLQDFSFTVSPPVAISAWIDEQDQRVSHLQFLEYEQGQSYEIALTRAIDRRGVDWPQSSSMTVVTTNPLSIVEESPKNESMLVSREIQPEIVFNEDVANRDLAIEALRIEPEVAGHFEWSAPNRVRFVPEDTLPAATQFAITLQSGPSMLRGQGGGYVPNDHTLQFTTERGKVIDVDLTRQVLTLFENDQYVWSTRTATGVRGAETPPGTYTVHYKMPTARFRGVNPGGSRYDIPDVPWVMAFFGDYTIHGAYWRTTFGQPGSNGCVSMTTADAKLVYDWTPVGTPVVIHY